MFHDRYVICSTSHSGFVDLPSRWCAPVVLKCFLFRRVTLPVPSILTLYWSFPSTSMMMPVLSQRSGVFPARFWMLTMWPTRNGDNFLLPCDHFLCSLLEFRPPHNKIRIATPDRIKAKSGSFSFGDIETTQQNF